MVSVILINEQVSEPWGAKSAEFIVVYLLLDLLMNNYCKFKGRNQYRRNSEYKFVITEACACIKGRTGFFDTILLHGITKTWACMNGRRY